MSTVVNYDRCVTKVELTDLIDSTEVAEIVGLSVRNSVTVYRRRYPDFPSPAIEKGKCVLWLRADIERWAKTREASR